MIDKVERIDNKGFVYYVVEFANGTIANVPDDQTNRHYISVQEWIKDNEKIEVKKSSKK